MRPPSESLLDTIVALATPMGRSALALVRLSGPRALDAVAAVARGLPRSPAPRHPSLLSLCEAGGEAIDRGLVTYFAAPASYTGEDMVEISVHGSPVVVRRLLDALAAAGARPARPGEFTERAYRLGKMDLVEAEAVGELIDARTEAAARFSSRRLSGALSARLAEIRESLLSASAGLTVTLDFAEDVGEALDPSVSARLRSAGEALERLLATYRVGRLLSAGCRVALLGLPNAGKSTLFNALLGSERAIVTAVPGTTRDVLEATMDIRGIPVELVDTAGLRESEELVEKIGVQRARAEAERADAVLYVFDASAGFSEEDRLALESLDGNPITVLANKADRVAADSLGAPEGAVAICGISPDAGTRLRRLLEEKVAAEVSTDRTSEVLSSLRQRDLVARASAACAAASEALAEGVSPEYASTHCDEALDALADLVGETTTEEVLQRIFEKFCIGK
jgi:tRNA modification GTPase